MASITIMIVESSAVQAENLKSALAKNESIEVISAVSSRETAVKQLANKPDVILLNPEVLKQRTLSRFIRSVQTKSSNSRVLLLLKSMPSDAELIADIKAGVRGYVKLSDPPAVIARAVRSVTTGGEIWAERRVLAMALSRPMLLPETLHSHIPGLPPLTNREMEMLTMVLQGATNKEIAASSSISERTVKTHLYRIYKKLKVKSRTKAIALLSHS
jgi:DNA-binding NarL/FixJ family response regulator